MNWGQINIGQTDKSQTDKSNWPLRVPGAGVELKRG